ncbi:MAG: DVUA0089 family protein [Tepidisphaerales bacterium]
MRKNLKLIAAALPLLAAASAQASFTFPVFNPVPDGVTTTWRNLDLVSHAGGSVTPGSYVSATVLVDWTHVAPGSQWSSEARVHFASGGASGTGTSPTLPPSSVVYAPATSPANGLANTSNVSDLRFNVGFSTLYLGGTDPLFFNFRQTFGGSNARWSNVRITLNPLVVPTATQAFLGGSIETTITGRTILWYTFDVDTPGTYMIDTVGSIRTDVTGQLDTEIGLYDSNGTLIVFNDDIASGNLNSRINPTLSTGTYYLAVGLYDTTFGGFFTVSSSAPLTATGNLFINGIFIPEPAALGVLAPVAALLLRRRA